MVIVGLKATAVCLVACLPPQTSSICLRGKQDQGKSWDIQHNLKSLGVFTCCELPSDDTEDDDGTEDHPGFHANSWKVCQGGCES